MEVSGIFDLHLRWCNWMQAHAQYNILIKYMCESCFVNMGSGALEWQEQLKPGMMSQHCRYRLLYSYNDIGYTLPVAILSNLLLLILTFLLYTGPDRGCSLILCIALL